VRACRLCDTPLASLKTGGAVILIRCNLCNHLVCEHHIRWRKVKGLNAYRISCMPKCILRKRRQPEALPVKTGVDEWDYFHPEGKVKSK